MSVTFAREIAFDAFIQVMENRRMPEDILEEYYAGRAKDLKRLDRNFIKELLWGSLRWYSKMYWILQNTSDRDLTKSSPEIRAALVLGTYQIYYMDRVADRAAVNESVEYVRKKGRAPACPFVNGILRQIARRAEYFAKPDKEKEPVNYLALQYAHPKWLIERWFKHFRFERLETMLAANNSQPPISVRMNTLKIDSKNISELQDLLLKRERTHTERRTLRGSLHFRESPLLDSGSMFAEGYYTIQDEAAQLISFLVAPAPGEHIVDACAGPGGKLSHMYELAKAQAFFYAIDRSKSQFLRAQNTMERLRHNQGVNWFQQDFLEWNAPQKVDKVLLDSPCSGLGVLRRHPEGKWHKEVSAITVLRKKQRELLMHGLKQLRVGGELTYAVCSSEPEETSEQLAWLIDELKDKIEVITPVSRIPDYYKKYVTRDNMLLIFSGNKDDMDGFGAFSIRLAKALDS